METISLQEMNALTEILNRTPMTLAERLFIGMLLEKLVVLCNPAKSQADDSIPAARPLNQGGQT